MIRFCDREVGCVEYGLLNRGELLSYYLSGHIDDMVIVYDSFGTMRYVGRITYHSLLYAVNMNSAIRDEYVILNQDIWKNAREYFDINDKKDQADFLLPVLDEEYRLVCFAYEDEDANREIRMLRELSEHPEALQFTDVYPDYLCVKICEFNELAYFFAKYLESHNIAVQVEGKMWNGFFADDVCTVLDYACLTVFAEGIEAKKKNLFENILRSVSVEFEYIDRIYEANINNGVFQDANRSWEELAAWLRDKDEIVILGNGIEAQRTYGFLIKNGIDICCFMGELNHKIFGKEILTYVEIRKTYKAPIYIDCQSKGSAWGMGSVDYYDYIGYERNKGFILLKDYVEIPDESVIDAVKNRKIAMIGDLYLCRCLSEYLLQNGVTVIGCLGMMPQEDTFRETSELQMSNQNKDITWLIVVPVIYDKNTTWQEERKQVTTFCKDKGLEDYTEYFSFIKTYIDVGKRKIPIRTQLIPKRIVIGAIDGYCGNIFFRGLLDSHPSMMIIDYGSLNVNLFWICCSLSVVDVQDILPIFWSTYGSIAEETIYDKNKFNKKMKQLMNMCVGGGKLTSQELFVMFHIAYMCMIGKDITEYNIKDMVVYWEIHRVDIDFLEDCVKWLNSGADNVPCSIINLVRNMCMKMGARLKGKFCMKSRVSRWDVLECKSLDKKAYEGVDRLTVRFEDLKCNPKETLLTICNQWDIPWSDTLMKTTKHGERESYHNGEREVSGFDLGPVYDINEKYFSAFDRLRIMIFNAPWQRKYGYPYVEQRQFSRRELQEMFLRKFRFESLLEFSIDEKEEMKIQKYIRISLQEARRQEIIQE